MDRGPDVFYTPGPQSSSSVNSPQESTRGVDVDKVLRPHIPGRYSSALEAARSSISSGRHGRSHSSSPPPTHYTTRRAAGMGSISHFVPPETLASPFFAASQGWSSERRKNILSQQKPRSPLPFELPDIDTDFIEPEDVNTKVFWPLPDQYERKPDPELMPTKQQQQQDAVNAAKKVLAEEYAVGNPYSHSWSSTHSSDFAAAEKDSRDDDGLDEYHRGLRGGGSGGGSGSGGAMSPHKTKASHTQHHSVSPIREEVRARVKSTSSFGGSFGDSLGGSMGEGSATPPPIRRSRRYIIDDTEEMPRPDSFSQVSSRPTTAIRTSLPDPRASDKVISISAERPQTAVRVEGQSLPQASQAEFLYGHADQLRPASDQPPPPPPARAEARSEVTTKPMMTPALDRIQRYEQAEKLQAKPKPPNFSLLRKEHIRLEHEVPQPERDTPSTEKYDSGVGMSEPSGSSKDQRSRSALERSASSFGSPRPSQSGSSSHPVDFFSHGIYQVVLHNPATSHQLLKFCERHYTSENVEFLKKVEQYRTLVNNVATLLARIHKTFISEQSQQQINVKANVLGGVHSNMKSLVTTTLPGMESMFDGMQDQVEQIVFDDVYPRFVRYQMAMETAKSLMADRHRYQGLGDCFCFSSPNHADNPVVYASDGFVKVTGYNREEIIPRNCRFLQGPQTDRKSIRRVKEAINEERETVELLLNYKKNGSPFWNLLYTAPLVDETGKVVFFLGGQINCSTTIHTNTDVMRILSIAHDDEQALYEQRRQEQVRRIQATRPRRRSIFKAFRSSSPPPALPGASTDGGEGGTGLERKVLDRMEGNDLKTQIREFYSAYSKYLVVRSDDFTIKFWSAGVMDTLVPVHDPPPGATGKSGKQSIGGRDVFKFFKANQPGPFQSDFKSSVKKAIKLGLPISVGIRLQTRRSIVYRGDENFMTHWTPLKNEHGTVHWVVITLAQLSNPSNHDASQE